MEKGTGQRRFVVRLAATEHEPAEEFIVVGDELLDDGLPWRVTANRDTVFQSNREHVRYIAREDCLLRDESTQ